MNMNTIRTQSSPSSSTSLYIDRHLIWKKSMIVKRGGRIRLNIIYLCNEIKWIKIRMPYRTRLTMNQVAKEKSTVVVTTTWLIVFWIYGVEQYNLNDSVCVCGTAMSGQCWSNTMVIRVFYPHSQRFTTKPNSDKSKTDNILWHIITLHFITLDNNNTSSHSVELALSDINWPFCLTTQTYCATV